MGYHLQVSRQNKKPEPTTTHNLRKSLAPALKALALVDIQDDLGFAVPAVGHNMVGYGIGIDFHKPLVSAAPGTDQVTVPYG